MATPREVLISPIPGVPDDVSPALRVFLEVIKERLEVRDGTRGIPLDRYTTFRDLVKAKLASINPGTGLAVLASGDGHNHDNRYYTQADVAQLLSGYITQAQLDDYLPIIGTNYRVTPEGGQAVKLTNQNGSTLLAGTIVRAATTHDLSFVAAPAGSDEPIGVLYEDAASGSAGWVVTSGLADVLLADSTSATRGNWVQVSGTGAGRAAATRADPDSATHGAGIGHCVESQTAGTDVLARCVLHFN